MGYFFYLYWFRMIIDRLSLIITITIKKYTKKKEKNGGVKQMKKRLIILVVLILGISAVGCNKMEAQPEETTLMLEDGCIDDNPGEDAGLKEN